MGVRQKPQTHRKFYAVVTQFRAPFEVIAPLSGLLQAHNFSDAEIEAGRYREKLNEGLRTTDPNFFIIVAVPEDRTLEYNNRDRWVNREVNPSKVKRKSLDDWCLACEGQGFIGRKICGQCNGAGTKHRKYAKRKQT